LRLLQAITGFCGKPSPIYRALSIAPNASQTSILFINRADIRLCRLEMNTGNVHISGTDE
jgi:hypothetical protein